MGRKTLREMAYTLGLMRLTAEIEGHGPPAALPRDGSDLVAFMSFAVSRGFGAQHPFIALADRLHDTFGVKMGPMTTFYEADIEDGEDREKLELAWQEAGPLLHSVQQMIEVIESDQIAQALLRRAGAVGFTEQATALAGELAIAAGADARVRLSYSL